MILLPILRRLIVGAACLLPVAAWAADAPVVELPAEPPAARTVALEEVWRVGGLDDEEILLGLVNAGAIDDAGRTYLLDRQLSQVLVISPGGALIATLGREGDGPGEFRRASDLFLTADGVGVVQGFPGKVVLLTREGVPDGEISIGDSQEGGFRFIQDLASDGEHLVCRNGRGTFDQEAAKSTNTTVLTVLDLDGEVQAEFAAHTVERSFQQIVFDEAAVFAEHASWALGPDGRIYTLGDRDDYRINVRDLTGELLEVYARPFTPRERAQEDKDRLVEGMRFVIDGQRREIDNQALDTDRSVISLHTADDGRLFVVNCYGQPFLLDEGTAARYDVIGADGTFRRELTLTFPGFVPERDRLLFLDGEHFLVLRHFESAADAMRAGFGDDDEEEADLGYAEPLEVVLTRLPG